MPAAYRCQQYDESGTTTPSVVVADGPDQKPPSAGHRQPPPATVKERFEARATNHHGAVEKRPCGAPLVTVTIEYHCSFDGMTGHECQRRSMQNITSTSPANYRVTVREGVGDGTMVSVGGHEDVRWALTEIFGRGYRVVRMDRDSLLAARELTVQAPTGAPDRDRDLKVERL